MTFQEELDRLFYGPPDTTLRSTEPPTAAKLATAILRIAARIEQIEERERARSADDVDDGFHFPQPTGGEKGTFDFGKKGSSNANGS